MQHAMAEIDRSRAIVVAAGWHENAASLSDLEVANAFRDFEARVAAMKVDLDPPATDEFSFDFPEEELPAESTATEQVPYYLLWEQGRLVRVVLPFRGPGMWSTIHGLLALEADLVTVAGLLIVEHGETPGIGDRIEDPAWLDSWRGKRLYGPDGSFRLRVHTRPAEGDLPFNVDAITGATVTVDAVSDAVARWFGPQGYAPVLAELREEKP